MFSYSRHAYQEYQGMGAAFQNTGLTFSISSVQQQPGKENEYQFYTTLAPGTLHPGDEILLYRTDSNLASPVARVVYIGNEEDDELLMAMFTLTETDYHRLIVRSGFEINLT